MQQRTNRAFLSGTLLGAALAVGGMVAAQNGNDEAANDGMMQGGQMMQGGMMMQDGEMQKGMMSSMMKMMGHCNDMMAQMQGQHGQPGSQGDDAS